MKISWKTIMLLFVFILLSTCFYPMILGYWAAFGGVPSLSSLPKNRILHLTIFSLSTSVGALICSLVLAWPMGYFTRQKPIMIGGTLGIIGALINIYRFPMEFNWYTGTINIAEYSAFVLGCVLFTWCGCRFGNRRTKNG